MNTATPKRLLMMNILDILKRYTDEDHRLSQREIREILEREYQVKANRKTVKRGLSDLLELGYDLEYSESVRRNKDGEDETMLTDWYLNREFSDSELRLLIDSLLFSKHIPYSQCKELAEKLEGLSNIYFRSRVKHIRTLPDDRPNNAQLFYTIDVLDEAIGKGRQVCFHYLEASTDHLMHPRKNDAGEVRDYIVNPYQMVAANGRYYLIGNYDKYDNVAHYRVDRVSEIRLLDSPVKNQKKVKGLENGIDLPRHVAEHVYMFAGESVKVRFRATKNILNDLEDWFGMSATYFHETADSVEVTVKVNWGAMLYWALQYAPYVEVLEPADLQERIGSELQRAAEKYKVHLS